MRTAYPNGIQNMQKRIFFTGCSAFPPRFPIKNFITGLSPKTALTEFIFSYLTKPVISDNILVARRNPCGMMKALSGKKAKACVI